MSSKSQQTKLETFRKIFIELLNDLRVIRPNDSTLMWVKAATGMVDDKTLVSQFVEYIDEYADKILVKDETFFIEHLHTQVDSESFAGREISKVRKIWADPATSEYTKGCIWNYLIILVKLGKSIKF